MTKPIQRFLELLADRLLTLVGSVITTRVNTFRMTQHAESLNELEELARRYEEAGKPELAQTVRKNICSMNPEDPGTDARVILRNVLSDDEQALALPEPAGQNAKTPKRSRQRRRLDNGDNDASATK